MCGSSDSLTPDAVWQPEDKYALQQQQQQLPKDFNRATKILQRVERGSNKSENISVKHVMLSKIQAMCVELADAFQLYLRRGSNL